MEIVPLSTGCIDPNEVKVARGDNEKAAGVSGGRENEKEND